MPRSCAPPAPELDEPVPLETEPGVPLLDVLPLGLLLPELIVPEPVDDEPELLLPLGWLLPELMVPERSEDDPEVLPLGALLLDDMEPDVEVLLPLDTPLLPPLVRPPGAALALEDDCASLLQASKSACAGVLLWANAPPDTATTVAVVKIAVAVLKRFMLPPP
jgi:hypothetical protein